MGLGGQRTLIAALTLSAAGFVGIVMQEGYTTQAVIPVPGDVPTIGFGTTDGVRMGDHITPPKAVVRALQDTNKYQGAVKQCVHVPLHQYEYDAYVSLAYNIGQTNFCKSGLVIKLNDTDYEGACAAIEDFICGPATLATADARCTRPGKPPKKVINGLVNRRAVERAMCEGKPQ